MRCPCVIVDEPDYDTRHSGNDDTWYLTFILISLISFKRLILSLESKDPFQFYSVIILAPCKGTVCGFLLVMFGCKIADAGDGMLYICISDWNLLCRTLRDVDVSVILWIYFYLFS